jgi:hypothetical protein
MIQAAARTRCVPVRKPFMDRYWMKHFPDYSIILKWLQVILCKHNFLLNTLPNWIGQASFLDSAFWIGR